MTAILAENLSKQYRLGQVGRRTLRHDFNRWLHRLAGKDDPYLKIGAENNRALKSDSEYVWALRDVNFSVDTGSVVGIIGSNGAGKSTLLKILSKVTSPTTGSVKIKGRIASLLEVGTGFHPDLSGRDNVFLNGAILGMTRKEIAAKFDDIVQFAGVERYIDTPVKRYSSGMYVRLAFAVAAHLEPDILIVDEVLAVGDAEFQKKCLGKMKDVSQREGRTVLFVSHNMPAIQNLCDKVMVLQWGKNIFHGNTEDGINVYLNHKISNSTGDLQTRTDRKGNGLVRCSGISFHNSKGETLESVISGDDIAVRIHYINYTNSEITSAAIRLQVLDTNEQIIFTCNNEHSKGFMPLSATKGTVDCIIPHLPLFGATYFVNVQIYAAGKGIMDEIEFAKEMHVTDGDFFGTGKLPAARKGILIHHKWNVNGRE